MEIIERKAAKAAGLVHYFTGKPCKHGHIAKRFTGSGRCVECNSLSGAANGDYFRQYYIDHREKKIEAASRWYQEHRTETLERISAWQKANPDSVAATQRRYKENHPGVQEARVADWEKRNPDKRRGYGHARRERVVNGTNSGSAPTKDDLDYIRVNQSDLCAYCLTDLDGRGELDHKTPISRGGPHCISNVQWTCSSCNRRKSAKTDEEFRIYLLETEIADKRSARRANGPRTPTKSFEQRDRDGGGTVV